MSYFLVERVSGTEGFRMCGPSNNLELSLIFLNYMAVK